MPAAHTRTKKRRMELKLTQRQVAAACGVTQQAYEKFERGETRRPRYLFELAAALGVSAEWLRTGKESAVVMPAREASRDGEARRKVPVYGYPAGLKARHGAALETADVIDSIAPLPGLENTADAFAILLQGDELGPHFPQGTLLYLERHRPPSLNKPCLCLCAEGMKILMYVGRKGSIQKFRFIDSGKLKSVKSSNIKAVYRIVGAIYS